MSGSTLLSLWKRAGTTLEPKNTNDSVDLGTGDISSANIDGTPVIAQTSLSSKGGLRFGIDDAAGDIIRTSTGFIEDAKFGWFVDRNAIAISAEFDSSVKRTGNFTLKLSTTDVTGRLQANSTDLGVGTTITPNGSSYYKVKPSTRYKFGMWVETVNAATSSVFARVSLWHSDGTSRSRFTTVGLSGDNGFVFLELEFITDSLDEFMAISLSNDVAGNVSDAFFDVNSLFFQEVVEHSTDTLKNPSEMLLGITAVTDTSSIDQTIGGTGATAYSVGTAVVETATHKQTFTPTKTGQAKIGLTVVSKGTGDWRVIVHDSSDNLITSFLIANASLTDGVENIFEAHWRWTSGAYHYHVISSVADGTVDTNVNNDLEGALSTFYYEKRTTGARISQHIDSVELNSDEDGILGDAVIDLQNGKYSYTKGSTASGFTDTEFQNIMDNVFEAFGESALSNDQISNGFEKSTAANHIRSESTASELFYTLKFNTILPIKNSVRIFGNVRKGNAFDGNIEWSLDNSSWVNFVTVDNTTSNVNVDFDESTTQMNGATTFYIRVIKSTAVEVIISLRKLSIECDLDTSSIDVLYNQKTGSEITQEHVALLPSAATRVYYYETKYGYPHLEFTDGSDIFIGKMPIWVDTTDESVTIEGVVTADGAFQTITSTTTPLITVAVTLTNNRLLVSSNDHNASLEKDGSNQVDVEFMSKVQGLTFDVQDLQNEVNIIKDKAPSHLIATRRITSTTTLTEDDNNVFCDTDGGTFSVLLPKGINGTPYRIINTGSSVNNLTITPNGTELLKGVNGNVTLLDGESLIIIYQTIEGWF